MTNVPMNLMDVGPKITRETWPLTMLPGPMLPGHIYYIQAVTTPLFRPWARTSIMASVRCLILIALNIGQISTV